MATPEQNMTTVRRFFEAASTANFDDFDNYMVEKFVTHGDALFPFFMGRQGMKVGVGGFKNAFPDARLQIEEIFAEGDKVMAHVRVTGHQEKEWLGVPPAGKEYSWTATTIIRFDDQGQMVERWVIEDELGMMQQLGIMPRPQG
jgi:predicted ester cyclase